MLITENNMDRLSLEINREKRLEIVVYSKRGFNSIVVSLGEDVRKVIVANNHGICLEIFDDESQDVDGIIINSLKQHILFLHGGGGTEFVLTDEEWKNFKQIVDPGE